MWIQIRSVDGKKSFKLDNLSKLCRIENLRELLKEKFQVPANRLRLFHGGKQVEDGYTLFDYNVRLNDTIQVLVRPLEAASSSERCTVEVELKGGASDFGDKKDANKENQPVLSSSSASPDHGKDIVSKYYKVGNLVDAVDEESGAWFEGKITKIQKRSIALDSNVGNTTSVEDCPAGTSDGSAIISDDGLEYHVLFESYESSGVKKMQLSEFRPRARMKVKFEDIELGSMVMVNHNIDHPQAIGFWYDGMVMKRKKTRTSKELIVRLFIGKDRVPKDDCYICNVDDVFAIEKHKLLCEQDPLKPSESPIASRILAPHCDHCNDRPKRKCKFCGCHVCGGKENPQLQVLCDECDLPYHIGCLQPPLPAIPDSVEWYCPLCKNDASEVVKAGEKLKKSKKKSKMASATSTSERDWGSGMACVGRSTVCTIVPPNHFGPIPGVEVGSMWKYRVQVSESGVHRPHVGGIHGRAGEGAFSIVLSGGYEDDVDHGHEFTYTGSGGRDLSGNKRTAEQSSDQILDSENRALAYNCDARINEAGAVAKNWKKGKPVRVVRNAKSRKRSKYAPQEGNRYDGIYKVVRYWPETGKAGFLVWRYLLRRDDPIPPPWTKQGTERIKELGLAMQYPPGYSGKSSPKKKSNEGDPKKKSKKRKIASPSPDSKAAGSPKKQKKSYNIPAKLLKLIDSEKNVKLWSECKASAEEGQKAFLQKVEESFVCICCQEVVYQPVTTECLHNSCKSCLIRSFKAEVYCCPMCRHELGKNYKVTVNTTLQEILLKLFPGYNAGR